MTQQLTDIDGTHSEHGHDPWSNDTPLDHGRSLHNTAPSALPRVRADALCRALTGVELDALRDHHLTLAMAVIELAASAGAPLPWSHDDPTIALLRAAAKLAITAPDASSSAAADLIDQLHAPVPSTRRVR